MDRGDQAVRGLFFGHVHHRARLEAIQYQIADEVAGIHHDTESLFRQRRNGSKIGDTLTELEVQDHHVEGMRGRRGVGEEGGRCAVTGFAGVSFGSGTVTVRALAADSEGRLPAEVVAPAQRSPSLLWPVELTGTAQDPVLPAARALLSVLRAEGAVHHQFRLIAFRLSAAIAHIRYQRRDTGIEHEIAISVPTEADFAEGYESFRRAVPRLGALPIPTPELWADELVAQFKELFATGLLGSPLTEQG